MSSRPSSPPTIFTDTRPHSPDPTLASSPPACSQSISNSSKKPKGKPTVTPKTFTRFFTPRSPGWRRKTVGSSKMIMSSPRRTLQEITGSTLNGRSTKRRKITEHATEGDEDLGFEDIKLPGQGHNIDTIVGEIDMPLKNQGQPLLEKIRHGGKVVPKPIVRSKYRGQLGALLRRQVDEPFQPARGGRIRLAAGQYLYMVPSTTLFLRIRLTEPRLARFYLRLLFLAVGSLLLHPPHLNHTPRPSLVRNLFQNQYYDCSR